MKWINSHSQIRQFLLIKGNTIKINGKIYRISNDKHRIIYLVLTYLYYFLMLLIAGLLSKFLSDHFKLDLLNSIVIVLISFIGVYVLSTYLLWVGFCSVLKRENK